jgi:hypothetical protein
MENLVTLKGGPQGAAAQNLVGGVDSMSFMDHRASAVSNNKGIITASATHHAPRSRLFPNATPPIIPV